MAVMNTPRTERDFNNKRESYQHECAVSNKPILPLSSGRGGVDHRLPLVLIVLTLVVVVFLTTLMIVKTCAGDEVQSRLTTRPWVLAVVDTSLTIIAEELGVKQ